MAETKMLVELERPAKKSGGDRYQNVAESFQIYIPQEISRPNGVPVQQITLTFTVED